MKRLIGRPGRFFLPLALGLCAAFGIDRAAGLMAAILAARLCSLCAGSALRGASSRVVNGLRLTGNYYLAVALGLGGWGVSMILWLLPASPFFGIIGADVAMAGGLIMLSQLAADGLYTLPDALSGGACDGIIALFSATGLIVSEENSALLVSATGICALTAGALSLALRKRLRFRSGYGTLISIPGALLRTGIPYGALMMLLIIWPKWAWVYCIFWGFYEAMEAPIRRAADDCRYLHILCALLTAFAAVTAALVPGGMSAHIPAAGAFAAFMLMLFSGHICLRGGIMLLSMLLTLCGIIGSAAGYPSRVPYDEILRCAPVLAAAALACAITDVADVFRHLRAGYIAKRRGTV